MKLIALAAAMVMATTAHAESFFQVEAGLGAAYGQTLNDGVWYQQGNTSSQLHNKTPAYMVGITGESYRDARTSARYHFDYVYFGSQSASCMCVPDDAYDPKAHVITDQSAPRTAFSGGGHVQGIAATLDVGYDFGSWRVGVEGGPWVFWETWHQTAEISGLSVDASHRTVPQLSWVAGANVSRGNFTLSYRYYNLPQRWNPNPALLRAAHVLMMTYHY
jgi:hypothetical protein